MRAATAITSLLFALSAPFRRVDLSAWLSSLSYGLGLAIIGEDRLLLAIAENPFRLLALVAVYIGFLVTVLRIQKNMCLALTATSFGKPSDLYTSGAFRYSRNPIYLAFLVPLASLSILSPLAAAIAILFYIPAMTFTVIRREEGALASQFGPSFAKYVGSTPRWLVW